jgi:alanine racemase
LEALRHNARVARAQSGRELMAVVKANGYGHGAVTVARALDDLVAMFGVANFREGMELREAGIQTGVLLLGACLPEERTGVLKAGFHFGISSVEEAQAWDKRAGELGVEGHAHIVLDTGMGRMGFIELNWSAGTVATLVAMKHLVWEGIGSHLPSPDEDSGFTAAQIDRFGRGVAVAATGGMRPRWMDLANSAGLLGYPAAHRLCNLVRPGLMLYGVDPLTGTGLGDPAQERLRPALTWKARVVLVRELPSGHGVSYGRTHVTERPTLVATVACGYADGYPRQVSGKNASLLLHGRRCPLLGRVTMDQVMVDVGGLGGAVQPGDEAVLLGCQGEETISAAEVAAKAGTISWHVFTGIGARVARVAVD